MTKLIAVAIASAFALGTVSTFAADAVKKDELTTEQRADLRDRVAKLKEERAKSQTSATTNGHKDKR